MLIKKIIFLIIILGTVNFSWAQKPKKLSEKNVPSQAKSFIADKYPDVKKFQWISLNNNIEASFSVGNKTTVALFSENGKFIVAKTELAPRETPGLISKHIRAEYKGERVNKSIIEEYPDGNFMYYFEVSRPGVNQPTTILHFDFNGNLIKTIKPDEAAIEEVVVEEIKKPEKPVENKTDKKEEEPEIIIESLDNFVLIGENIRKKELPSKINSHINKITGFRFDSAVINQNDDHGMVYEIKLRRQGYREYKYLLFDFGGNFIEEIKR